ncbi:hypothetical protein H0H93_003505 [Arthromyces matolae]|nr:hypothetical protein H0H93_003505 [Arthromyces matolae]
MKRSDVDIEPAKAVDNEEEKRPHVASEIASSTLKALPDWLRSTFSTLATKHPLRLLLPRSPSSGERNDAHILKEDQSTVNTDSTNLTFAFDPSQLIPVTPQAIDSLGLKEYHSEDRRRDELYHDVFNNFLASSAPTASSIDHIPTMNTVLSSTPEGGPANLSRRQSDSIIHQYRSDLGLPSDVKDLGFLPFSTPGPGSTIQASTKTSTTYQTMRPDTHIKDNHKSVAFQPSLTSPRRNHTPLHYRNISDGSSSIDICLPPYHAAPSDPAPDYSDSNNNTYDVLLASSPDRESRPILRDSHNFAMPDSGFSAPQPLYFDSPTEDPSSEPDYQDPGYAIDLDTIDFRWAPFNRHPLVEKACALSQSSADILFYPDEEEDERIVNPLCAFNESPASSAFPHASNTHTNISEKDPPPHAARSETLPPSAPGIFISPLREPPKDEVIELVSSRTTFDDVDFIHGRSLLHKNDSEIGDPHGVTHGSQESCDSIQSWSDVNETAAFNA